MDPRWTTLEAEAKARFGVTAFRAGQRELLEAVLERQDALGILPTGGGKSLTYQLPSLLSDAITVVVSPLLALTRDQRAHLARAGIDAVELDSTLSDAKARGCAEEIAQGKHRIVYVTPERLRTEACLTVLKKRGVALVAIDEAHCISQWGHDFRPSYLSLAADLDALGRPPVLALTATATKEVREDIVAQLRLRTPRVVHPSVARRNLAFAVERTVNEEAKRTRLVERLGRREGPGIVYAATVKTVDALYDWLSALKLPVARYHAQRSMAEREEAEAAFLSGERPVMVATKAFGLGVDKKDVRFVVHYEVPDSIESYYQEAGRGGRDGNPATATLLYRLEDRRIQSWFLATKYPRAEDVAAVHAALAKGLTSVRAIAAAATVPLRRVQGVLGHLEQLGYVTASGDAVTPAATFGAEAEAIVALYAARRSRDRERLKAMLSYAETTACREGVMLRYFDEAGEGACGRCDNCRRPPSREVLSPALRGEH